MIIDKLSEEELKDIKRAFTVFMIKVVKHHSLNFIKKERLNNSRNLPLDEGVINKVSLSNYDSGTFFYENKVNNNELEKVMTKSEHTNAILRLSKRERQILKAIYIDKKKNQEVAEEFNITYKTVSNTRISAINKLRKYLEE